MSALTISDLPPELLYTILSHALADVLFDYLFAGALVPNDHPQPKAGVDGNPGLHEISSLGGVSVAWRITIQRILGAVLHCPNQDDVQSLRKQQQQPLQHLHLYRAHHQLTARPHASATSINRPKSVSATSATAALASIPSTVATGGTCAVAPLRDLHLLLHYRSTLRAMRNALRDLVRHSIDTYRSEQDAMSNQTGVTTPTLLPFAAPPMQTPSTPPLLPHSIPSLSQPPTQLSFQPPHQNDNSTVNGNGNGPHTHPFGALLLVAAPAWKEYAVTPLFREALCYSQAAIFTCSSSPSFAASPLSFPAHGMRTASAGMARVPRPDLSTLVLTTARLVAALEWVKEGYRGHRICPREISDVADGGMRDVRERMEDAIQVCRWNDLLDAVFLRGERSEEMPEALDGCFDELEANANTIQMHHLLRSNLFKTVQTIARLGPISLVGHHSDVNVPSPLYSSGEVWKIRAGALSFRWMGRVVEWTGL